jgi:hypothetical protein
MRVLCGFAFATFPLAASAEVMDKEPSASFLVAVCLAAGLASLLAARFRAWILLAVLPYPMLLLYRMYDELADPSVGPAIRSESPGYDVYVGWAIAALTVPLLIGIVWRALAHIRRSRRVGA